MKTYHSKQAYKNLLFRQFHKLKKVSYYKEDNFALIASNFNPSFAQMSMFVKLIRIEIKSLAGQIRHNVTDFCYYYCYYFYYLIICDQITQGSPTYFVYMTSTESKYIYRLYVNYYIKNVRQT